MLKKIFKFSIYFISSCLFALSSYYFVKVYFQNEPIIISKNFSNYENNLKNFISKKTSIDKNKIKLKDVEFKLSKLGVKIEREITNGIIIKSKDRIKEYSSRNFPELDVKVA